MPIIANLSNDKLNVQFLANDKGKITAVISAAKFGKRERKVKAYDLASIRQGLKEVELIEGNETQIPDRFIEQPLMYLIPKNSTLILSASGLKLAAHTSESRPSATVKKACWKNPTCGNEVSRIVI